MQKGKEKEMEEEKQEEKEEEREIEIEEVDEERQEEGYKNENEMERKGTLFEPARSRSQLSKIKTKKQLCLLKMHLILTRMPRQRLYLLHKANKFGVTPRSLLDQEALNKLSDWAQECSFSLRAAVDLDCSGCLKKKKLKKLNENFCLLL